MSSRCSLAWAVCDGSTWIIELGCTCVCQTCVSVRVGAAAQVDADLHSPPDAPQRTPTSFPPPPCFSPFMCEQIHSHKHWLDRLNIFGQNKSVCIIRRGKFSSSLSSSHMLCVHVMQLTPAGIKPPTAWMLSSSLRSSRCSVTLLCFLLWLSLSIRKHSAPMAKLWIDV